MHQKEINALRLFEALANAEDQSPSQREIAKKLKISLGLVNALIKKLVQKGYFEICTISESKTKYLITSQGAAERSRLNHQYIEHSLRFYRDIQEKLRPLFKKLKSEGKEKIVLFGKGDLSIIADPMIKEHNLTLVSIVENEKSLIDLDYDMILVLQLEKFEAIAQSIESMGIANEKIMTL